MSVPEFRAVVVPARQAYSHWASVGRSNFIPVFVRRMSMKELASTSSLSGQPMPLLPPRIISYETRSTGLVSQ